MQEQVQEAFNNLQTEVQAIRDTEQAAVVLIQGLKQQLADALSNDTDEGVIEAVQAIHDQLETDVAPLAAAVASDSAPAPASDQEPEPAA